MAPFIGGAALPRGAVGGGTAWCGTVASMGRFDTYLNVVLRAARRADVHARSRSFMHDSMIFLILATGAAKLDSSIWA